MLGDEGHRGTTLQTKMYFEKSKCLELQCTYMQDIALSLTS